MFNGQPLAVFQPFIDTATGRIAGVEALARLRSDDGRLHSAGQLFSDTKTPPTALRRLDREVREQALTRFHETPQDWFLSLKPRHAGSADCAPNKPCPALNAATQRHRSARIVFELTELGGASTRLPGVVERRLILSSTYRDATTNQYCLTAGQFIDNGKRLLLIDIDAAGL